MCYVKIGIYAVCHVLGHLFKVKQDCTEYKNVLYKQISALFQKILTETYINLLHSTHCSTTCIYVCVGVCVYIKCKNHSDNNGNKNL